MSIPKSEVPGGGMAKRPRRKRIALRYPKHAISPEDLLHFIESKVFTKAWDDLGLNDEEDLTALQLSIMCAPKEAPVVPGTGGLRKLRFAPVTWRTGARGATRVCYVFFEEHGIVLLVYVYDKRQKDNLTAAEKQEIRAYIRRQGQALNRRGTI
jgi:hypothetical protein